MSHLDDGTLHAYLDGELSAVERARVDAHMTECAPCRDRLAEERSLIERADRLLSLASPPADRAFPVRPAIPVRPRRWLVPSAWAASIAVAFVGGWLIRPAPVPPVPQVAYLPTADTQAAAPVQDAVARPSGGEAGRSTNVERRLALPAVKPADSLEMTTSGAAAEPEPAVRITPGVVSAPSQPTLRGATPAPQPAAKVVIAPAPVPTVSRQALAFGANGEIGTSWPVITAAPARSVLGTDVVKIPGLPVRDIRQDPRMNGRVMVEQEVAEGVVIQLLQGRADAFALETAVDTLGRSAATTSGRAPTLRRNVGSLWVRISGPLSNDSLLKLLQLAR